uniref:NF-kappa-B inhibitor-like protein 1 n=1 Tax=Strigamia maritima TaxID=126957 RepID=T1J7M4_STRMM
MASESDETHLTSYKLNRIYRYVRKGYVRKLNTFLNEQYIDIRRVVFSKRRNALHIACKHKQKDIVKFLLRHDLNLLFQDAKGNVPLLTSALTNLKHKRSGRASKISDLLISACSKALTVKNNEGICAQEVLEFIRQKEKESKKKKRIFFYKKLTVEISSSDSSESEDSNIFSDFDSEESDSEWLAKMQMEFEDVYFQEFGKFENDFMQFESDLGNETYDDWADRMRDEFSAKRRRSNESHYRKRPKPEEPRNESTTNKLKREFKPTDELTGLKLRKRKYEKQCKRLFENDGNEEITLKDLPVLNEMFIKILLCFDSDESVKKYYLKKQQVAWHPDKFLQKCGQRLLNSDRDAILERVNQISQLINSHLDAMTN